jgi:Leucine-rich repeat (LRR) protein
MLHLEKNKLEELPKWIGVCEQLEVLNVAHNRLTVLPCLQQLTKLKTADFSHNRLVKKPEEEIARMDSCQFDFSGNPF